MKTIWLPAVLLVILVYKSAEGQNVVGNNFYLNFPLKIDTTSLQGNYKIKHNPNHPLFWLTFIEQDSIIFGDLILNGLFDITLSYEYGNAKQINKDEFLFKSVNIHIIKGSINDIFNKISETYFYSVPEIIECEDYQSLVDTRNKVVYSFNFKYNSMTIWDPNQNFYEGY